jgi:cobalt-zinc-cadmium efflux system outer membrane protein
MDAFRAGETNYLELLTAQRSLFKTRLSAIEALAQAQQAIAEINGQLVTVQ